MTTTALIAELVVGGVQTLVWLAVLALLWCEPGRLLGLVRPLSPSASGLLVAMAYAVGVVFDRVWDSVLKPASERIKVSILKRAERAHKIRAMLFTEDPVRANFIDYIRSRMRIARSTLCNSALTAVACSLVWRMRMDQPWSSWLLLLGSFFGAFTLVAAYAYRDITRTYYQTLDRLESYLAKK